MAAPVAPGAGQAAVFVDSTTGMLRCTSGTNPDECLPTSSTASSAVGANVTMTNANQYYDGPSITVAAGTWMIVSTVTVTTASTASAVGVTCKLWNGSSTFASPEGTSGAVGVAAVRAVSLAPQAIVVSTGATYKVSCAQTIGGGSLRASPPDNSPGNFASTISAVRLK